MAYNRDQIFEQAKQVIKDNNLFFIEDIVAWLPISKPTFYEYFPVDSNELNTLKNMVADNKIKTKSGIRAKLYKEKGTSLIALYKMICTDEERKALSMTYQESKQDINATHTLIVVRDEHEKEITEAIANDD